MIEVKVSGDFGRLGRVVRQLQGLAAGRFQRALSPVLAKESESLVRESFDRSRSPSGSVWRRLKKGAHKPLVKTGRLRDSIKAQPSAQRITLSSSVAYAAVHQYGAPSRRNPARPYLPGSTWPVAWEVRLRKAAQRVFQAQLGGAA